MVTVAMTMPLKIWIDWNADCENNFGGVRYVKLMLDHKFRKEWEHLNRETA